MNPCIKCGNSEMETIINDESKAFLRCTCGQIQLYTEWNEYNEPEPDPLATALDELVELYCFLEEIKTMDLISIRLWANDLLSKRREANNASN